MDNRDMVALLAFAILLSPVGCTRNPATDAPQVPVVAAIPQDAASETSAATGQVEVLWSMPTPTLDMEVAIGEDGSVGIVGTGTINDHDASRFLGRSVRSEYPGTGIGLFVLSDATRVVWERRAQTQGYAHGLVVAGPYLVTGSRTKSPYAQVGVRRPTRAGPPETAVGIASKPDADVVFQFDAAPPTDADGIVLGAARDTVFTLSGGTLGRVAAWRGFRAAWFIDPVDPRPTRGRDYLSIQGGSVVGDEIALCAEFEGSALRFANRPPMPLDGYERESGGVVVWLSSTDGTIADVLPLRGRVNEEANVPCTRLVAVRDGVVVTEFRADEPRADIRLVRREGKDAPILLSIHHDHEAMIVESDGRDQIVVLDQNFVSGAEDPYPVTVTVIDTARGVVRWSGPLPNGVGGFGRVALRGDLLVYAGQRVGPMEIDGKMLPTPGRDASDAGIVVALKLPPLP